MAQTAQQREYSYLNAQMRGPFVASGLFHLTIFLMTIIGIPFVMKPPPDVSIPISVEIVDIADVTTTNKVSRPVEKTKEEDKPAPKPEKPSPPEMTEETPPDVPAPPTPDAAVPKVSELAVPDKAKPDKVVKPAPKKPPVKAEKKKEPDKKDFNTLLKNLTPDAKDQTQPQETMDKVLAAATDDAQVANLSDKLTMSEVDALRHQLAGCWNVLTGAKYAEDLVVEVRVTVNPDRTVQQATIINQPLYNTDTYYRAAADAAIRALHNPRCSPLALPVGKYNEWKTTIITFDPRDML